jgi:hypothetical protein
MDKNHIVKCCDYHEIRFAVGSREGYHGPIFTKGTLLDAIAEFQGDSPVAMPVKVTDHVTFINKDYVEDGWEISAICYPNHANTQLELRQFMNGLAEHLLYKLKQNRITVIDGAESVMLEKLDAEKTYKK